MRLTIEKGWSGPSLSSMSPRVRACIAMASFTRPADW